MTKKQFKKSGKTREHIIVDFQEEEMDMMLDLINICKKLDIECNIIISN